MKKLKVFSGIFFLIIGFANSAYTTSLSGKNPAYNLQVTCFNCGEPTINSFVFKIHIRNTDSTYFEYSGGQYSFELDTSFANGGVLTYEIVSSELPVNLRPKNPSVTLDGQNYILNLERNDFPGAGNGYILTDSDIHIVTMRVSTTAPYINTPIELEDMRWRNLGDSSSHTRIFAYVDLINTDITTPNTHIMDFIFPVNLNYFTANVESNNVTLSWATSNELNNSGFDIERYDIDNQIPGWQKISFVEGNGTTGLPQYYIFIDRKLNTGRYNYRLKQIDYNGIFEYYNLSNEVYINAPSDFYLFQNFPNPFNPVTKINFEISKEVNVKLIIFDINGKELVTIVNELMSPGYYEKEFSGNNFPSGVYFYQLKTDGFVQTRKMVLTK
jgi:hypothetical protein